MRNFETMQDGSLPKHAHIQLTCNLVVYKSVRCKEGHMSFTLLDRRLSYREIPLLRCGTVESCKLVLFKHVF